MSQYTTGEMARLCGVTVRTVQFYDEKGLLPPAALSEGGRRIYTEADAAKLRKILLLKSLGLRLADIRGVLGSHVSGQVLIDILRAQSERLDEELAEKTAAKAAVAAMIRELEQTGELPEETPDMETIMAATEKTRLRESELAPLYREFLAWGIPEGIVNLGTFVYAIVTGNWWPFIILNVVVGIPMAIVMSRKYRRETAYRCAHCGKYFRPESREWFFANHTPTTRKVTCTHCGTKDWCAEVSAKHLEE